MVDARAIRRARQTARARALPQRAVPFGGFAPVSRPPMRAQVPTFIGAILTRLRTTSAGIRDTRQLKLERLTRHLSVAYRMPAARYATKAGGLGVEPRIPWGKHQAERRGAGSAREPPEQVPHNLLRKSISFLWRVACRLFHPFRQQSGAAGRRVLGLRWPPEPAAASTAAVRRLVRGPGTIARQIPLRTGSGHSARKTCLGAAAPFTADRLTHFEWASVKPYRHHRGGDPGERLRGKRQG
jgi:hypothetical protein